MTLININNVNSVTDNISGISSVSFDYVGEEITAIQPIDRLSGVFISDSIPADSGFVRWLDVSWNGDQTEFDIAFFVRSSTPSSSSETSEDSISDEKWIGPYYNKTFDIGLQKGRYLQFMVVMTSDSTYIPKIRDINVRYISSSSASKLYTKAFNLGFKPETILLTYNADLSNDTIVNFYVSGEDSVDPRDYQAIEPNKIETLTDISIFSDKVKILMDLAGEFTTNVNIHEFAFIVGGNDVERINKIEMESTSSSLSSETSSSSSSSIDSSSSFSSSSSSDLSGSSSSS